MAESADALDSGSSGSNTVCVQVTLSAPPQSLWWQIAPAGRKASVEIRKLFSLSFPPKNLFLYTNIAGKPCGQSVSALVGTVFLSLGKSHIKYIKQPFGFSPKGLFSGIKDTAKTANIQLRLALYSVPHAAIASRIGRIDLPSSVREYSTLGGTSG